MDTQAMLAAVQAVLSGRGATAEMLLDGLPHAVQGKPEERHELQAQLLKMVAKALEAARCEAEQVEAIARQSAEAAQADLDARKGALASASEAMELAKAAVSAQEERLRDCQTEVANEEQEHKRVDAANKAKADVVNLFEQRKAKVLELLEGANTKGSADAVVEHLRQSKCDPALVAALPSIYKKEPCDRTGFDLVALAGLRTTLEKQAAAAEDGIVAARADKVNIHAESLGAWAVMQLARNHAQEAQGELEAASKVAEAERESVREAKLAVEQEERTHSDRAGELNAASEKVGRCRSALEALQRLEAGQQVAREPEVSSPAVAETAAGAEVDSQLATAKLERQHRSLQKLNSREAYEAFLKEDASPAAELPSLVVA